jgi:SAM-dependent methyltransferase
MFWPDVIELKSFYASALGQIACRAIRRRIHQIWPEAKGETLLGVGYATPYLLPYLDKSDLVVACMPAGQGVVHWPLGQKNLSIIMDEAALPFPTGTVNRLLLVHALEHTEQTRRLLAEAHRVLTPSGRLLVVVPNRRGIWARSPASPFAHGQPFSIGQLKRLLGECQFTVLQTQQALYMPPVKRNFILRSARIFEILGMAFFTAFGGVILTEAEKQIYAPTKGKLQPIYHKSPLAVPASARSACK